MAGAEDGTPGHAFFKKNCVKCHKLDQEADYASHFKKADRTANDFVSNFSSISKDICIECHRRGKVREDCTMCHNYHNEAGNKRGFQEVKNTLQKHDEKK